MGTAQPTDRSAALAGSTGDPSGTAVVAIHQPNFFPWLGYFDKVARADVFVVLDSVQFPKKQGTWMNRVRVLVNGEPRWMTLPVDRTYHGVRSVREMRLAPDTAWREDALATLRHAYGKAAHFAEVGPVVEDLMNAPHELIADFNLAALAALVERVVPDPARLVHSSALAVDGAATELLVAITKAVGGGTYLCGSGAGGYQDDDLFADGGVTLRYQDFTPQPYPQVGSKEFVPGLSILDALFNLGFEGTAALLGSPT